jgi:hypothetical protein
LDSALRTWYTYSVCASIIIFITESQNAFHLIFIREEMVLTSFTRSCCSQNLLGATGWSLAALATNAINSIISWFCIVTTFLATTI